MPESAPAIAAPPTVSRPDPDPTTLTTQALYREINQVQTQASCSSFRGAAKNRHHGSAALPLVRTLTWAPG